MEMSAAFEAALLAYSRARSLNYTVQYMFLNALSSIMPGTPQIAGKLKEPSQLFDARLLKLLRSELLLLLKKDVANIRKKVYPLSVLAPEKPLEHFLRFPKILLDGVSISRRRFLGKTTEFGKLQKEFLDELPKYYQRNFHFQTNGYLSERSARLYEHQVELLFGGSADAMRRLIIPELRRKFGSSDGKGLRFLEIAAGTGRTTRFVHLAFPKAKIVASDLSGVYLKEAQRKLANLDRIDFVQADGTSLPFQSEYFDAVYSVFLYHELPLEARKRILIESRRVLKPGGLFGFVDSLQAGDRKELDKVLADFPEQFHEPFYRNYIEHSMEQLLEDAGFSDVKSHLGFLSKVCSAL